MAGPQRSKAAAPLPKPHAGNDREQQPGKHHEACNRPLEFFELGDERTLFAGPRVASGVEEDLIVLVSFECATIDYRADQPRGNYPQVTRSVSSVCSWRTSTARGS